jgi:hypothetical protein
VGQELLAQLAQLPALQELDLSHCSKVCNSALEGLQAASKLSSLNLSGCFQVRGGRCCFCRLRSRRC